MGIRPVVLLVMYRTQVQVGLQLAVGTLYLTGKVVIVPCGLLVKGGNIGPEEIDAAMPVHVLRHGNAPLYVRALFFFFYLIFVNALLLIIWLTFLDF